ncbi:MAG: cellulase family glycosylhydrolase [Fimbriimonas sp.]|nr:cellulase family glycosylhydrolase [Fimbriimonas sp.]
MVLTAILVATLLHRSAATKAWFGPAIATFQVQFGGNPYDPDQNDVRVQFTGPSGPPIERIAYYDGVAGYKAVIVAPVKGLYKATLIRNGKKMLEQPQEGLLNVTRPLEHGYVHPDTEATNRFRYDDGTPFYPIGFNLGWQGDGPPTLIEQLTLMGKNDITWSRIWACNWDGKNPWWPQGTAKALPGQLWPKALDTWQEIVDQCERSGIEFQFVLFHHGLFTSKVNPNWPDHPWNAANGGFLKDAGDFFTDPEAKRRTKMWLRYAVARYGASPSVFAWELFNEVEWVDARYEDRWADIEAWHREMAAYIRSIDPYGHMITTSSAIERKGLYESMDYYQPHTYPSNVLNAVAGANLPKDKPAFFGEFGPPTTDKAAVRAGVRDGIYGGITANQAGPAMFWSWDEVGPMDLYGEFKNAAEVIHLSEFAKHPNAKPLTVRVSTAGGGDLTFGPGGGWDKMEVSHFKLPDELTPDRLAKLPGFFQSMDGSHKDMGAGPITLQFTAKQPGKLTLRLAEIAQAGAKISIFVNGALVKETAYPAKDKTYVPADPLEAAFPAGPVSLRVENHGADWARIADFTVTGAGSQATGIGVGESDWMLLRLTAAAGLKDVTGTVTGLSIGDGDYNLTTLDLDSGNTTNSTMSVRRFSLPEFKIPGHDCVLIFKRK